MKLEIPMSVLRECRITLTARKGRGGGGIQEKFLVYKINV